MKTNRILFLALIVSAAFAVSVQADDRHKGNNNNRAAYKSGGSSGAQVHSVAPRFAQRSGYSSMGRNFQSSPRMTTRSMPSFSSVLPVIQVYSLPVSTNIFDSTADLLRSITFSTLQRTENVSTATPRLAYE